VRRWLIILTGSLVLASSAVLVHATIRVNGNQLLSASGDLGFSSGLKSKTGAQGASAAPGHLISSLGLGVIADGQLPDTSGGTNVAYRIGIGLGYDIASVVYNAFCPVTLGGDVNGNKVIGTTDIIYLANYILRDGPDPVPCAAAGDVNCSGDLNMGDVVYLVNYIFRSGPEPCDVCALIPGTWSCP